MENPLTSVYFLERCNVCGDSYPITLYEVFRKQHLDEEWQSARPCDTCSQQRGRLVDAIPARELTDFAQAWERLAAALQRRGLTYHSGSLQPTSSRTGVPQSPSV